MLLCLSSGYRQRYLEDILRAVAMPAGLDLRFRYTVDHISRDLHDPLKNNGHQGEVVLIGYLDRSDSDHAQEIVPCRFATLQESKILGDICVLTLRLTDYAFAESESDAMAELQLRAKDLPHWDGLKPAGKLCQYLGNGTLRNIKKTSDIGDWQKLVDQLNIHTDFNKEPFFYRVTGLYDKRQPFIYRFTRLFGRRSDKEVLPKDGFYPVASNSVYEIRLMHYDPKNDDSEKKGKKYPWIVIDAQNNVVSLTSNNKLAIDSPYDAKIVRFRTVEVSGDTDSIVAFYRVKPSAQEPALEPKPSNGLLDFDLDIRVHSALLSIWIKGSAIGVLLAAQGYVPIYFNTAICDKLSAGLGVIVLGYITGVIAAFGLKRP